MWLQGAEIIFILEDATVFLTQAGNAFKPAIREAMSKKNSGLRLTLVAIHPGIYLGTYDQPLPRDGRAGLSPRARKVGGTSTS